VTVEPVNGALARFWSPRTSCDNKTRMHSSARARVAKLASDQPCCWRSRSQESARASRRRCVQKQRAVSSDGDARLQVLPQLLGHHVLHRARRQSQHRHMPFAQRQLVLHLLVVVGLARCSGKLHAPVKVICGVSAQHKSERATSRRGGTLTWHQHQFCLDPLYKGKYTTLNTRRRTAPTTKHLHNVPLSRLLDQLIRRNQLQQRNGRHFLQTAATRVLQLKGRWHRLDRFQRKEGQKGSGAVRMSTLLQSNASVVKQV
jgi:hypothetical protein